MQEALGTFSGKKLARFVANAFWKKRISSDATSCAAKIAARFSLDAKRQWNWRRATGENSSVRGFAAKVLTKDSAQGAAGYAPTLYSLSCWPVAPLEPSARQCYLKI